MNNLLFAAHDFPLLTTSEMLSRFAMPYAWTFHSSEGFGAYTLSVLWNWPLQVLVGLFATLGLSFNIIVLITHILPIFIIGYFSIRTLLKSFNLKPLSLHLGTCIFLINSYILMVIDGGQFSIGLAYALLPAVYVSIVESTKEVSIYKKIKAGLLVSLLGIFDIRYIFIALLLIVLLFFYLLVKETKATIKKSANWLLAGCVIGIVFFTIHAYWIFPILMAEAPQLPARYDSLAQLGELSFATVGHAMLLLHPHWYLNNFGTITSLIAGFVLFPIAALSGVLFARKSNARKSIFWLFIAFMSILLIKGVNPPIAIYPWLFTQVPGFSLFRDPTKFFVLLAMSYSVLITLLADRLNKKTIYVFIIVLALLYSPVWLGKTTGIFSPISNYDDFHQVHKILENDTSFGRILWLPSRHKYGYSSSTHPAIEGLRIADARPFATGRIGKYEQFNFIRDAEFMDDVFDTYGIEYIAYPKDTTRNLKQEEEDYYATFSAQLAELDWLDPVYESDVLQLYKNENSKDKIFLTNKIIETSASDAIYSSLNSQKMYDTAVIYKDNFRDSQKINIASKLPSNPGDDGWWSRGSDFAWVRDFFEQKYGITNTDFDYSTGYALAEGKLELTITDPLIQEGRYLYARVLISDRGGTIDFKQNNSQVGTVETLDTNPTEVTRTLHGYKNIEDQTLKYTNSYFRWVEVGILHHPDIVQLITTGDLNVINALAITVDRVSIPVTSSVDFSESSNNATVEYEMINPTQYEVSIQGLDHQTMLVFSEQYNDSWEMRSSRGDMLEHIDVYNGLNGFYVESDGKYKLNFSTQKYVYQGLVITITGVILILLYIMRYVYKSHQNTRTSKD